MSYRICIAKGDFRFEAEGDKKFVLEMLAKYGGENTPVTRLHPTPAAKTDVGEDTPPSTGAAVKKTSIGEFVRQFELKKHTDLVLGFGYYLEKVAGLEAFTSADINNCYYEAKIEKSNSSQMIIQNVKKGYMMPAKPNGDSKRQAFVLTRSGEEFVISHGVKKSG